jgi:hypothetical protein
MSDVSFDPGLEISPYTVWRRRQCGPPLVVVDLRPAGEGLLFADAVTWPGPDWQPPEETDVVLVDADGTTAVGLARRLRAAGHRRVRALFGGSELFELALGTFLDQSPAAGSADR